jgi:hypothetical protein
MRTQRQRGFGRAEISKGSNQFALSDLDFQKWHSDRDIVLLRYSVVYYSNLYRRKKLIGEGFLGFE